MAEQQSPDQSPDESSAERPPADRTDARPDPEWRRRRRLAEVFGDVLPDTTSDEREGEPSVDAPDAPGETPEDRWLRSQVPPHHG
jgi:hypothetical protein